VNIFREINETLTRGVNITKENPKMYTRLKCIHRKGFSLLLFSAPLRLNFFTAKAQRVQRFFSLVVLCVSAVEFFYRKECRDFFLLLFFCVSAVKNAFTAKATRHSPFATRH
jgi:hypothetical protein